MSRLRGIETQMPRLLSEEDLAEIVAIVKGHPNGATQREIAAALEAPPSTRSLQRRIAKLLAQGTLVRRGRGRKAARYVLPSSTEIENVQPRSDEPTAVPLSTEAIQIRKYINQPLEARKPVGYNRPFLDSYRPNVTFYLSPAERAHLAEKGKPHFSDGVAGTYAKHVFNRLLIDLSWNSSRLEGNTYSLLDTRRLIDFGRQAEGRDQIEAQMILNHKEAISFLVNSAEEIAFNRYTIMNLHGILADNLLPDPGAPGRLRRIAVAIDRSTFHPLEVPQLIEECFDQILATAAIIDDPFEQALFFMTQLPYLQPFEDVNKRVSRLASNIPFIKRNLSPLSFIDVPRDLYTSAVLGVYELNKVSLLRDVFIWAYERSAAQYEAVQQSIGAPDPFRLKYSEAIRDIVSTVIRQRLSRPEALNYVLSWSDANIDTKDRERFRDEAETALLSIHEGNFARYHVRPSEFNAWQRIWLVPAEI